MAEKTTEKPAEKPEAKRRTVFRNHRDVIFYLKRRSHQPNVEPNFLLGPGQSVEAIDDDEEALLAHLGLVDIAKEAPAIKNTMDDLKKQLADAQAQNASLKAENSELEKQVTSIKTQGTARSSKK